MAQITTLKDNEGKTLYPITSSQAVLDDNGIDVETKLSNKVGKEQGKGLSSNDYTNADKQKLDSLPTSAELTQTLNDKQGKLQNSEDVNIEDDKLSVTERAKREVLIDEVEMLGAAWNDSTGYFELNGLADITYEQMLAILDFGKDFCPRQPVNAINNLIRTNILTDLSNLQYNHLPKYAFYQAFWLEVVRVSPDNVNAYTARGIVGAEYAFFSCRKLREIQGAFTLMNMSSLPCLFLGFCDNLSTVHFIALECNIDISTLKSLSAESLQFCIANSNNKTKAITITVHADVYAKLTGDTTNAAYNDLSDEEKQQWTALIEQAAEKNIQFATA